MSLRRAAARRGADLNWVTCSGIARERRAGRRRSALLRFGGRGERSPRSRDLCAIGSSRYRRCARCFETASPGRLLSMRFLFLQGILRRLILSSAAGASRRIAHGRRSTSLEFCNKRLAGGGRRRAYGRRERRCRRAAVPEVSPPPTRSTPGHLPRKRVERSRAEAARCGVERAGRVGVLCALQRSSRISSGAESNCGRDGMSGLPLPREGGGR